MISPHLINKCKQLVKNKCIIHSKAEGKAFWCTESESKLSEMVIFLHMLSTILNVGSSGCPHTCCPLWLLTERAANRLILTDRSSAHPPHVCDIYMCQKQVEENQYWPTMGLIWGEGGVRWMYGLIERGFFSLWLFNFRIYGYIEKSTKSVTAWCHEKILWQQPIATKGLEIESIYIHIHFYSLKKTLDIDRSAHRTKVTHQIWSWDGHVYSRVLFTWTILEEMKRTFQIKDTQN